MVRAEAAAAAAEEEDIDGPALYSSLSKLEARELGTFGTYVLNLVGESDDLVLNLVGESDDLVAFLKMALKNIK